MCLVQRLPAFPPAGRTCFYWAGWRNVGGERRTMRRRQFIGLIGSAAAWPLAARAQHQSSRVFRLGFLRVGPPPPTWIAAFRRGLREHGLIEGRNIEIEFGLAESVADLP